MSTPLEALAGVPNAAQPLPQVVTGGQPAPAHFEALKRAGVEVVLDIRDPMEPRPFDEPALVRQLGMEYVNVSVTGGSLDDGTMERILTVLRTNAYRPVLLHCASGNRVGGPLIAHLMLDHGATQDDAIQTAMRSGLRGADILQWGLDFVEKQQG
ncbi:MAG: hypothetical protein SFV24_22860 [Gemmatimonadales bacterium]|nr:hypothetical protein [Gemmatimonadales bacterium]